MDVMDPVALWSSYSKKKNMEDRNKIFQYYSPWIKRISSYQYSKYKTDCVNWSDCVQNASVALLELIDKYDVSRCVPFEAYAYSRIKGAILNGLNDPERQHFKMDTLVQQEIIEDIDFSGDFDEAFDRFLDVVIDITFSKLLDLSSYRFSQIGVDPLESYIVHSEEKKIISAIHKLPSELQFVVVSHYHHFLTFSQISDKLEISKSRVSQLHKSALKYLREIYEKI